MRLLIPLLLGVFLWANPANAGFEVGITDAVPISVSDATNLGVTIQRRDIYWSGQTAFTGNISMPSTAKSIVMVSGSYYEVPLNAKERETYCNFVGSILDQYPNIIGIVIWNEPSEYAHYSWPKDLSLRYYGKIVSACAPIIHAHNALVIGPGMHPMIPAGAGRGVIQGIADEGGRSILDVFDLHMYWADVVETTNLIRSILGPIPIWVTEDGIQSIPPLEFASLYTNLSWTDYEVTESQQASIVSVMMRRSYCAGVNKWFNFLMRDDPNLGHWHTGLERPDGSHKPAYQAVAQTSDDIQAGRVNCKVEQHPVWTPDELIAQKLGQIGGWARDAYTG